jgi:hypothetical protein
MDQLVSVVIRMIMIANLQYGRTLLVNPMSKAQGWSPGAIQTGYSAFIALETRLTPIDGLGWIINSAADSLTRLYVGCSIARIGGGAIYATSVGHAVKWFPDRRRSRRRPDSGWLWSGRRAHRHSYSRDDRRRGLHPGRIPVVWNNPGRHRLPPGLAAAGAFARRHPADSGSESAAVELHAPRWPEDTRRHVPARFRVQGNGERC